MQVRNESPTSYVVMIVALSMLMAVSCGGGGGSLPAPGAPQPQQQQPPLQQQPPQQQLPPQQQVQPQAPLADTAKISAIFNDQQMSFTLSGSAGAVMASARVIIEDPQNFVADLDAQADGSFVFGTYDVPPNFMTAPGTAIRVYQFDDGHLRSEPATVTVQLSSTP